MPINTRRRYLNRLATIMAAVTGTPMLFAQQTAPGGQPSSSPAGGDRPRRANHTNNGIYYFSGIGSNDGYGKDDHVLVTDPFEKHVVRPAWMPLKKSGRARRLQHGQHPPSGGLSVAHSTPTMSPCRRAKLGLTHTKPSTTH